ncbi:D-2-hydroxyacid dehydrogenase [Rhizobium panacihumi]|uniref:D-2-hydroxyacid dehydrogenase n=1 Tax=Rhizobium panacihumi TaxID=2008450 RepID=UPI003D7A4A86
MKIIVLDGFTLNPGDISWAGLEDLGEVTVYDRTPEELTVERIGDADAIFTNKTVISRDILEQCPDLRFIGVLATGYNVVDIDAAKVKGIPVCNVPTYGTMSVAQFATALLLELCHQVGRHSQSARSGQWAKGEDWCYWLNPLFELHGKNLGIIGFGRIGQAFGRIGQALGMNIIAHDSYRDKNLESDRLRYADLNELYAEADVISLHCPLFADNVGMINTAAISRMKPGVFLINTSRGPLINEQDLADALNQDRIAGAGLDVLSSEPPAADNPLLTAKNCIVTPHIAWAAREPRMRIMATAVENLRAFIGGKAQNVVNA